MSLQLTLRMEKLMLRKFNLVLCLFAFFGCSLLTKKETFRPDQSVSLSPGEVIKVNLDPHATKIICKEKEYLPALSGTGKYFVYAESYFSKYGKTTCEVYGKSSIKLYDQTISITARTYPYETLSVNPKRVKLSKKDLKRVLKEREVLSRVYSKYSSTLRVDEQFKSPLSSKVTSEYGTRRLFNNVKKSQHLGIDFRAKVGVPIPSSNKGKVVLARDLFYTGNTVIIDHGLGIFTLYGHLSKLMVRENQMIEKGEVLGEAGKTGRVTGPHLHWGVKVNGHWVDGFELSQLTLP